MAMLDVNKVIFEALIDDVGSTLYSLVGTRIDVNQLPTDFTNTDKRILYFVSGGGADDNDELFRPVFTFRCYGGANDPQGEAAFEIYRALHDVLKASTMMTVATGVLLAATEVNHGQVIYDPGTEWAVAITQWECEIR